MGESETQDRFEEGRDCVPVSRRINITKSSRRLETISKGDILIFLDREEVVKDVDIMMGNLYTKRKEILQDRNRINSVVYDSIEKIYPQSKGRIYNWTELKINKNEHPNNSTD